MTGIFCVCLFSYSVLLEVKNTYLDRASGHAARKHCSFAVLCLTAWMVHDFTVGTVNCMVGLVTLGHRGASLFVWFHA
jgi:hypothetical protein